MIVREAISCLSFLPPSLLPSLHPSPLFLPPSLPPSPSLPLPPSLNPSLSLPPFFSLIFCCFEYNYIRMLFDRRVVLTLMHYTHVHTYSCSPLTRTASLTLPPSLPPSLSPSLPPSLPPSGCHRVLPRQLHCIRGQWLHHIHRHGSAGIAGKKYFSGFGYFRQHSYWWVWLASSWGHQICCFSLVCGNTLPPSLPSFSLLSPSLSPSPPSLPPSLSPSFLPPSLPPPPPSSG